LSLLLVTESIEFIIEDSRPLRVKLAKLGEITLLRGMSVKLSK